MSRLGQQTSSGSAYLCVIATVTDLPIYSGHRWLSHDFKYGPALSKAVGPVDPSFLVVKKSHFNKKSSDLSSYSESMNSTKQKEHVGSQYSKTYLKQPLKKDKTKILITKDSLMKVKSIAECILHYF